jgi:hypothetical protein
LIDSIGLVLAVAFPTATPSARFLKKWTFPRVKKMEDEKTDAMVLE